MTGHLSDELRTALINDIGQYYARKSELLDQIKPLEQELAEINGKIAICNALLSPELLKKPEQKDEVPPQSDEPVV